MIKRKLRLDKELVTADTVAQSNLDGGTFLTDSCTCITFIVCTNWFCSNGCTDACGHDSVNPECGPFQME